MEYKGFTIESNYGHYVVTEIENPNNSWTEDTVRDAKDTIDELEE